MKKFNVTVNGKTYAVEVEEVGAGQGGFTYQPVQQAAPAPVAPAPVAPAPVQQAAPAPTPKTAPAPQSGPVEGETITAPMPGTILDIKVSEGQKIKSGDVLMILEAMKMENEIVSPKDGTVNRIHTTKSSAVSSGDALITIG